MKREKMGFEFLERFERNLVDCFLVKREHINHSLTQKTNF